MQIKFACNIACNPLRRSKRIIVEAAHLGYPGSWTEKFIFYLPIPLMSDPLHNYYSRIR